MQVVTYEALKPCSSSMKRWTSCKGLFCSLYKLRMICLYSSHCFVMVVELVLDVVLLAPGLC
jgi:hypothetical protein